VAPPDQQPPQQGEVIKLDLPDVMAASPTSVAPKSWLEYIGTIQMSGVLLVICGLASYFFRDWRATQPTIQDARTLLGCAPNVMNCGEAGKLLETFTQLQNGHTQKFKDIFQLIVLSGLVPLFTLLAGYVFGRKESQSG